MKKGVYKGVNSKEVVYYEGIINNYLLLKAFVKLGQSMPVREKPLAL
jgi:hypothetical protein